MLNLERIVNLSVVVAVLLPIAAGSLQIKRKHLGFAGFFFLLAVLLLFFAGMRL